jgi:hypothetical protein
MVVVVGRLAVFSPLVSFFDGKRRPRRLFCRHS